MYTCTLSLAVHPAFDDLLAFVCMHMHLCVCTCICVYALEFVCVHMNVCVCTCICAYVHVFVCLFLYLCRRCNQISLPKASCFAATSVLKHARCSQSMPGVRKACPVFAKHARCSQNTPGVRKACPVFKHAYICMHAHARPKLPLCNSF